MTVLSDTQIAALALEAGFDNTTKDAHGNTDAVIAVAVGIAESNGKTDAFNAPTWCYGVWQIRMAGSIGSERRAKFSLKANEDLFDPHINARVARAIKGDAANRNGWFNWTTYTTGIYLTRINRARDAIANPLNPDTPSPVHEPLPGDIDTTNVAVELMKNIMGWFLDLLKPLFLRTAGFVGGGVLVILGIILYIKWQSSNG
jgi:hypothetical protein